MRAFVRVAIALAIVRCAVVSAADPSTWFPDLTRLDLKDERVTVWYPKANAKPVTTKPAWLKDYEEAGVFVAEPLLLDLGHGLPALALTCDSGPSNDPSCRLLPHADEAEHPVFESPGNVFVFTPSADIYVFGDTDFTYDHRRLFRYDGKRFSEVAQPFRYVGIEGKTSAALSLTATPGGDAAQALITLPKGASLTILLNAATGDDAYGQNPDYLVKTREGLVGWARIPTKPDGTTIVRGLRYNGD